MAVEVTLVRQLVEATAYEAYKIVFSLVLKKASATVCVFYEKRRLKSMPSAGFEPTHTRFTVPVTTRRNPRCPLRQVEK